MRVCSRRAPAPFPCDFSTKSFRDSPAHIRRILADFEIAADKDLSASRTLAKLGPMLGLMGTLIPMGPALVGLSTGDISSMAYNMQVAFATTVVGLFSSAVGFLTQQVKNRWYMQDMTNLEFVAELLNQEGTMTEENQDRKENEKKETYRKGRGQ